MKQDSIYQELLQTCLALEPAYCRIRDSLPKEDPSILEQYISTGEEMEHRALMLALLRNNKKTG